MTAGPMWLQGQPNQDYPRHLSFSGQDVFVNLEFLDSTQTPVQPTTLTYQVDSLTSCQNVIPSTQVTPTGSNQTIQLPGASMVPTRQYYGRDLFQMWITATYVDSATQATSTMQQLVYVELIAIGTPS